MQSSSAGRFGVILAGGDGKRLLPLTRKITGDDTPKQFCALTSGETLLDETRRRVSKVVPKRHTFFLLNANHERYYTCQLGDVESSQLLVQPYNHGTGPAIAYSLIRLQALDPHATVAFFPCDHHFEDDDAFAESIDVAFAHAEKDREHIVLLGVAPESPEESYGWIEPGAPRGGREVGHITEVRRFWEKPSRTVASRLMRRGCLWNSFVMVGRVAAFTAVLRRAIPSLLASMELAVERGGIAGLRTLYDSIPATNFSSDVLQSSPSRLLVLRAEGLGWSDLGEPRRVLSVIDSRASAAHRRRNWFTGISGSLTGLSLAGTLQEGD